MNDIESRLADALRAQAQSVEPRDEADALDRVVKRVAVNRRRSLTVLGVAAAIALVVGGLVLLRRDNGNKQKLDITATSTTAPAHPSTTQSSPPASVIPTDANQAIWPFASSNRTFASPEAAAKSFAVDYLGMTLARVGTARDGEVDVFPNATGNALTVVQVEERSSRGWVVTGARADQIVVDTPKPHDTLTNVLRLSGRSVAFEAQVGLQLRPFGSTTPIAEDFAMGGSTDLQPFDKQIAVPVTDQPLVLILFEGDASGRQTFTKATVIPLDATGPSQPTDFVGLTGQSELLHLDFAGHIQQSLAKDVAQFAYSPAAKLVAYSPLGDSCRTDFVSVTGSSAPDGFAGTVLVISADGKRLTYATCSGAFAVRDLTSGTDVAGAPDYPPPTPPNVENPVVSVVRGRFGTVAFFDGTHIASYNPANGNVVQLVQPAATPVSLDADESGRYLMWVDANHDVWTWSGSDPVKVASGFNSAAW